MTGRWLTLTAAASRIADAVRRPVSIDDVKQLGEENHLTVQFKHEHFSVLEKSVDDYLKSLPKPPVGAGPALPDFIEDEFERAKGAE